MNPGHIPLGIIDQTLNNLGAKSHGRHLARLVKMPFGKSQPTMSSNSLPLSDINIPSEAAAANYFPFLQYAKDNWSRHTVRISPSSKAWSLWQKIDVTASYAPWTNLGWQTPGVAPVGFDKGDERFGIASDLYPGHHGRQMWLGLHNGIVFSDLLDHQPLLAKIISKFISCGFWVNITILERLFKPRTVGNPSKYPLKPPLLHAEVRAHELVVDCVTRYTASGAAQWPGDARFRRSCPEPFRGECRKTIHRQTARILDGDHGRSFAISKEMQVRAEASVIDFDEDIFARLTGNILLKYPRGDIPDVFRIAIERGSPWSFIAIDSLLHHEEPQQKRYKYLVESLIEFQDLDTLFHLLELKHSSHSGGIDVVRLEALESVLANDPDSEQAIKYLRGVAFQESVISPALLSKWENRRLRLPPMLRQRFIELCIPPGFESGLSKLQELFRRAVWTSSWDIAVALRSCILSSMPTTDSAFEPIHPYTRDEKELLDEILECLTEVSRPCNQEIRMGNPFLRCCEEHRSKVSVMVNSAHAGLIKTTSSLFHVLETLLKNQDTQE